MQKLIRDTKEAFWLMGCLTCGLLAGGVIALVVGKVVLLLVELMF